MFNVEPTGFCDRWVCVERERSQRLKFLTGATGRMEFPLAEVGRLQEERFGGGRHQSPFWVLPEVHIRHPSGEGEFAVVSIGLAFRERSELEVNLEANRWYLKP